MQLVAYGAQDIYLTGQPQITFFKSVYRRHTNFATESILQTINGQPAPGNRVSVTVSRNGDLLKNLWIQYKPNGFVSNSNSVFNMPSDFGHALLDYLELEIGGQLIDRQYGRWLTIWRDLTETNPVGCQGQVTDTGAEPPINSTSGSANELSAQGFSTRYQRMSYTHQFNSTEPATDMTLAPTEAYIPMRFWFCRNPGLAIPLIALQYHEVKFNINFQQAAQVFPAFEGTTTPTSSQLPGYNSIVVYADYVYLDTTERRQFAQNAHEYLIDQLQWQNDSAGNSSIRLNFNHPVKELIWTGAPNYNLGLNLPGADYYEMVQGPATPSQIVQGDNSYNSGALVNTQCKIVLNGTDRFTWRNLKYFTRNQVWDCHTGFGATGIADSIAVYSFALRPEEHQPSGTCNFSRIDTAQLQFLYGTGESTASIDIYAVNYNVLRIMSGMGGLAYSN